MESWHDLNAAQVAIGDRDLSWMRIFIPAIDGMRGRQTHHELATLFTGKDCPPRSRRGGFGRVGQSSRLGRNSCRSHDRPNSPKCVHNLARFGLHGVASELPSRLHPDSAGRTVRLCRHLHRANTASHQRSYHRLG